MSTNNLIGANVSFFLDGGWQISGVVTGQESDKIILERNEQLFLLFKNKVNFFRINKEDNSENAEEISHISDDDFEEKENFFEESFPENGISYSETFMNIPTSLLNNKNIKEDDDFSVSFKESNTNNILNFKVEDDS